MSATNEKLERLFDKIRSSSEARQAAAIEALSDIASERRRKRDVELIQ